MKNTGELSGSSFILNGAHVLRGPGLGRVQWIRLGRRHQIAPGSIRVIEYTVRSENFEVRMKEENAHVNVYSSS